MSKRKKTTRPLRFRIEETFVSYRTVEVPIDVDYESAHEFVEELCNNGDIDITEDCDDFSRHVDLSDIGEDDDE